ncbi:MAG: PH domain-containing protein [Planctomycetes bacterium]|nr:PH domain-containing protein [Planctomycetota bacterium]
MTTTVAQRPPAIAGLSGGKQTPIATVYPSVSSTALGKALGQLYECLPIKIFGIKLSYLLFPLPTAIIGVKIFFYLKLFGEVYVLTNRTMQIRRSIGNRLIREIPLSDITEVVVKHEPGQEFFSDGDIYLLGKSGQTLMSLPGVGNADVFRQTILEAQRARNQVAASLATISARH